MLCTTLKKKLEKAWAEKKEKSHEIIAWNIEGGVDSTPPPPPGPFRNEQPWGCLVLSADLCEVVYPGSLYPGHGVGCPPEAVDLLMRVPHQDLGIALAQQDALLSCIGVGLGLGDRNRVEKLDCFEEVVVS